MYHVCVNLGNGISINDMNNNEVLYWRENEWRENPSLMYIVISAIRQAYEQPEAFAEVIKQIQDNRGQ